MKANLFSMVNVLCGTGEVFVFEKCIVVQKNLIYCFGNKMAKKSLLCIISLGTLYSKVECLNICVNTILSILFGYELSARG